MFSHVTDETKNALRRNFEHRDEIKTSNNHIVSHYALLVYNLIA